MLNAMVTNNIARKEIILNTGATVRQAFSQAEIDYGNGVVSINGTTISGTQMDMTIEELGFADANRLYIMSVVKADNAA